MSEVQNKFFNSYYPNNPHVDPALERQDILAKLCYLLDNLQSPYKSHLVTSKINRIAKAKEYSQFDRARALVAQEGYYKEFFNKLELEQLKELLNELKPGLETGAKGSLDVERVYNHVYQELSEGSTADLAGNVFSFIKGELNAGLQKEEQRLYAEANEKRPARALEPDELARCGNPCEGIFTQHLTLLDPEARANFNDIIRKTVNDVSVPTCVMHEKLLHTARWLAVALSKIDKKKARAIWKSVENAEELRHKHSQQEKVKTQWHTMHSQDATDNNTNTEDLSNEKLSILGRAADWFARMIRFLKGSDSPKNGDARQHLRTNKVSAVHSTYSATFVSQALKDRALAVSRKYEQETQQKPTMARTQVLTPLYKNTKANNEQKPNLQSALMQKMARLSLK